MKQLNLFINSMLIKKLRINMEPKRDFKMLSNQIINKIFNLKHNNKMIKL